MNKEAVQAWVEALRSGDYKQARSGLCSLDAQNEVVGYCCLGVACEIYAKTHNDLLITNGGMMSRSRNYDKASGYLPEKVYNWLTDDNKEHSINQVALAARNDAGRPFLELADLIEELYLEGGE